MHRIDAERRVAVAQLPIPQIVAAISCNRHIRRDPIPVALPHRQTGAPPSVLDLVARRDQDLPAPLIERSHDRSEEHTSELQSLMRTSYAVFCLKKKT